MRGRIEKRVGKKGTSYRIRWEETGSNDRSRPSQTYHTKQEAETALAKAVALAHEGNGQKTDTRPLSVYLSEWLDTGCSNLRPPTKRRYADLIKLHINPALGRTHLAKLTPLQVQNFYKAKLSTHAPGTVAMIHMVLHKSLRQAVRWGILPRNVTDSVQAPSAQRAEHQTWDADQVAKFLLVAKQDDYAALWHLAVFTGLRRGELLGLKWEDLDLKRGTLSIRRSYSRDENGNWAIGQTKTRSSTRFLSLPPNVRELLRTRQEAQKALRNALGSSYPDLGFIFDSPYKGRPLHVNSLMDRFHHLTEAADLPRISFHSLRHTSATLSLKMGTHPKIVQSRLGHSSIAQTLDTYSHVSMQLGEAEADALEKFIEDRQNE